MCLSHPSRRARGLSLPVFLYLDICLSSQRTLSAAEYVWRSSPFPKKQAKPRGLGQLGRLESGRAQCPAAPTAAPPGSRCTLPLRGRQPPGHPAPGALRIPAAPRHPSGSPGPPPPSSRADPSRQGSSRTPRGPTCPHALCRRRGRPHQRPPYLRVVSRRRPQGAPRPEALPSEENATAPNGLLSAGRLLHHQVPKGARQTLCGLALCVCVCVLAFNLLLLTPGVSLTRRASFQHRSLPVEGAPALLLTIGRLAPPHAGLWAPLPSFLIPATPGG